LPSKGGKNKNTALMCVIYVIALIIAGFLPFAFSQIGLIGTIILSITGIIFLIPAVKLYFTQEDKDAKQLMFASLIYLPVSLFVILFDKI
jgi:protoheme IX farnesyltransferase